MAQPLAERLNRPIVRLVVRGGSIAIVLAAIALFVAGYIAEPDKVPIGLDLIGYRRGFERFLATGSPYQSFQLAGPFSPEHLDFIQLPSFLPLIAPFTLLPTPLDYLAWLAVPLVLTLLLLRRLAWWAYPIVAVLAITGNTLITYINGNSSMYLAAAFGWSLYLGWPAGLIALKPSLAPFALPGLVRARRRFVALALLPIAVTLPFTGAWSDFFTLLRNAQGLGPLYSLVQWPVFLIVALPWLTDRGVSHLRRGLAE